MPAADDFRVAPEPIKVLADRAVRPADRAILKGVRPELAQVVVRAATISEVPFIVTEGLRTLERQTKLVAMGASKTMRSRHLTGHAVDLAAWMDADGDGTVDGGEVRWDWPLYAKIAAAMKQAATELGVPIEWGGDWTSFKDGPHFQLPWREYP